MVQCMIPQIHPKSKVRILTGIAVQLKHAGFCSQLQTLPDGSKQVMLQRKHPYVAQVQGQMAVGGSTWCDFVMYTKSISIERIYFDEDYWLHTLLPKLIDF